MPVRGYIIEKYNAMTNAYTCNRLVQEASALDMDLQIVGIHDTVVSPHGVINHGKILEPVDFVQRAAVCRCCHTSTAINGDGKRML